MPGLGSANISFLFQMMYDVLPTKERIARKKPRASPACQMPGCDRASENRGHTLVLCRSNNEVEVEAALRLELGVEEDL